MGKKPKGAALRAKKRAREAVEQIQEQQAADVARASVTTKANEDLFVLDTVGDKYHPKPDKKKAKKHATMKEDQSQVEKWMKRYNNDALKLEKLAKEGKERMNSRYRKKLRGNTKASFDLWGEPEDSQSPQKEQQQLTVRKKSTPTPAIGSALKGVAPSHVVTKARKISDADERKKAVAIDVAKSGQSYHPDPVAHQAVLGDAVHLELAREKAIKDRDTPIDAGGMLPETRALLVGDSDSDESSSDEMDQGEMTTAGPLPKRAKKKTRAQRNKEQRLRVERAIQRKEKTNKKLINQVSEIPRYKKEIRRHRREKEGMKQKIQQTEESSKPLGKDLHQKLAEQNPIKAPTLPVALPSEIKSNSLRTMKPKGDLASERLVSLMDRNLAAKPTRNQNHVRNKKRKKSLKGSKNKVGVVGGYVIKG